MSLIALMLLLFVVLGLAKDRLGPFTYIIMGVIIFSYVGYTYVHPQ
jgi:hypothetical protein